jgi:hypothetical protein
MAALFDPERHEALAGDAWEAGAALAAIERIVAETRAAFTPDGLWPLHPQDADGGISGPQTSLYVGAAGVIWGLDHLAREGAASPGPSYAEHLPAVQTRNRRILESTSWRGFLGEGWQTRSWLFGDAGVLFTQWKTAPSEGLLAALADAIAENTHDPSLELMWGAPGTMLAALALYRSTGEAPWADLYRTGAAALGEARVFDDGVGADIWTQSLYGNRGQFVGAVHGFAGNAFALIQGRDLLAADQWTALSSRIARTLAATATVEGALANWAPMAGPQPQGATMLVQHCHGAPGIVTALSALDEDIDALLAAAGALIWTAGPLTKGANLCHGTAGNGHAFLKLFERTGDATWLDRARAFAMHAIRQSDSEAAEVGQRRYSLWTGDIGLACYLWECRRATARFPTADVL